MLTITYTPGYVWTVGEIVTEDKLNLASNPIISLAGSTSAASIGGGSITTAMLETGILSADSAGLALMADGYLTLAKIASGIFTANVLGRAPFAAGWLNLALVGTGIFLATPAGRAPFAPGVIKASLSQPDAWFYGTGGGSGTHYLVTLSPLLSAYVNDSNVQVYNNYWDGLVIAFKAPATSLAAADLNAGLGVNAIYRLDGTVIQAGDIVANTIVELRFNSSLGSGGAWQQMASIPAAPQNYRAGIATTSTSTTGTVTFSTAMPDALYLVLLSSHDNTTGGGGLYLLTRSTSGFTYHATHGGTVGWMALYTH
jgi:hypothetical protein